MAKTLRLATRGSPLALWQSEHVAGLFHGSAPDIVIELVKIETTGDQVRDQPLNQLGGEGLFTKQIQQALLENRADVAVHSLKDLPTIVIDGLSLAAVPQRGPTGDVFVSRLHRSFDALPRAAVIATGSQRRRAQLLYRRPDLRFIDIRGNVETRLRKLVEENIDALILAQAGLERLGFQSWITELLDQQWMLPAVGQGALALECRTMDVATMDLLTKLNHPPTSAAVRAERAMLRTLGGGCQMPIGATTRVQEHALTLRGVVLAIDGSRRIETELTGDMANPERLGQATANDLLRKGAGELLQSQEISP
jgi:hydroxymethylbilane synthase